MHQTSGAEKIEIAIAIGVLVVARFLVRELRERKIVLARIYLPPAILGAIAIALVADAAISRPDATPFLAIACIAGLAFGAAVGYGVAHRTRVRVTDDPRVVFARGSLTTVAIWVGALALRLFGRIAFSADAARAAHYGAALNAALLVLLASALFFVRYRLVVASRLERRRGTALASPAV